MLIRISDDALARALGADELAAAFEKKGCEVQRTSSWGMHWLEPLVEIDRLGYGPATLDDVDAILDGTSDKAIGPIEEHPFIARQQRLTFARAGRTRPLSLEDYEATGGWSGLRRARQIGNEAIVEEVLQSGLRGRGGAGFPAGIKWRTVMLAPGESKYIVCNADEGDSGTFADRMLMEGDPFALIEGMAIAAEAVGAQKGYVYLRSEYPDAIRKMQAAARLAAGIITPFEVEIRTGAGAYVCGEETSLLNSLEGKRGEVRAKPPLPALEGLFGKPTVVNNVLTLAAVPHIMTEGGASQYEALGIERSKGTMPIQIAGNIKYGGLFETAFGISLGELVNEIGGGTQSGRPVKAVQVGGPLGVDELGGTQRVGEGAHRDAQEELVAQADGADLDRTEPGVELGAPGVGEGVHLPVGGLVLRHQLGDHEAVALEAGERRVHLADVERPRAAQEGLEDGLELVAIAGLGAQEAEHDVAEHGTSSDHPCPTLPTVLCIYHDR